MKRMELDRYGREVTCIYRREFYHVRDNGAVRRRRRENMRRRPLDDTWTFGNPSTASGYMLLSSVPVHRIVATAFQGEQPSDSHVVDHIDTNRQNNRPENLRWVTRLENILTNPITAKRIVLAYGSIEEFLRNPSRPAGSQLGSGFDWMRTVSKEEANECYRRLSDWARKDGMPTGRSLGDWVFGWSTAQDKQPDEDDLVESKTQNAVQRRWRTPSEFPNCPSGPSADALETYRRNLGEGQLFARSPWGDSIVVEAEMSKNESALLVLGKQSQTSVKDWSLACVTIEGEVFVHESIGTFFSFEGAQKQFTLAQGLTWEGGDSIDDYC